MDVKALFNHYKFNENNSELTKGDSLGNLGYTEAYSFQSRVPTDPQHSFFVKEGQEWKHYANGQQVNSGKSMMELFSYMDLLKRQNQFESWGHNPINVWRF